jgi:predicted component of viral defense system (DUF524 family)
MTYRVFECELNKKKDITKILEADPYADDSFARMGYKVKDGQFLGEDMAKMYVYIKAAEDFLKKADERLKGVAERCKPEVEKRIHEKIQAEEESAEAGLGNIFG